ncbi:pyocin activator PrtN family protein [Phyllobacterium meliloti]|uniref:pyocin activator PrtN family protein n=1 Tax=Phyllobacterium meliloti TaxID=555317 RepID=UPI001D1472E4|nr:pyocin activator PrtN family protein [Phyllobacterium sp. T1293]UGX87154.1 pyocin activator PrtN family protein [Phyllobacterium sp. T1293]
MIKKYEPKPSGLNTLFFLMAQYGPTAVVPLDQVCQDYFSHLTIEKFMRKAALGEIAIPITRLEKSQRSHRGVHILDLAEYIDARRAEAVKEYKQIFE